MIVYLLSLFMTLNLCFQITNGFSTTLSTPRSATHLQMDNNGEGRPLLRLGTRSSPLALAQAYETKRLLGAAFHELRPDGAIEIRKIMTKVL